MLNRMMTQKEQFALLFVGLAIVLGALVLLMVNRVPAPEGVVTPVTPEAVAAPAQAAAPAPAESEPARLPVDAVMTEPEPPRDIAVAAMGAVAEEGLYRVDADMRVGDLIEKAGGLTEDADISDINLGAPLIDGTTLTVPRKPAERNGVISNRAANTPVYNPPQYTRSYAAMHPPEETTPARQKVTAPTPEGTKLNLNTATQAELETLPGIGPALAQRIMEYRAATPFTGVDQLDGVPGIGPKRLEQLRPHVTVD